MPPPDTLTLLRQARDRVADAFSNEVKDENYDNGSLERMTQAITSIEKVIQDIINRG